MGLLSERRHRKVEQSEEAEERKRETDATIATLFAYQKTIQRQVDRLDQVTQKLQGAIK